MYDLIVIGGGPAGMAAALAVYIGDGSLYTFISKYVIIKRKEKVGIGIDKRRSDQNDR